jgi:hypothetical protein
MSAGDQDPSNKGPTGSDLSSTTEKVGFVESNTVPQHHALKRQLKNRHVAMIRYSHPFSVVCEDPLTAFTQYWRYAAGMKLYGLTIS